MAQNMILVFPVAVRYLNIPRRGGQSWRASHERTERLAVAPGSELPRLIHERSRSVLVFSLHSTARGEHLF
jgi:hypothetical protein